MELYAIPTVEKLRQVGSFFVASNPTPGTGIATPAAPTSYLATATFVYLRNSDQVKGRSLYPDYLKLICTAAGTAGASTHLTFDLDVDVANTRYTSGGSQLTPVGAAGGRGDAGVGVVRAGALVTVAGPSPRIVSNTIFRPVIPVVGDIYTVVFGRGSGDGAQGVLNGTNPARVVEFAPAVEIPPQWTLSGHLWLPSQSAASSWEVEFGYWEGPQGALQTS